MNAFFKNKYTKNSMSGFFYCKSANIILGTHLKFDTNLPRVCHSGLKHKEIVQ